MKSSEYVISDNSDLENDTLNIAKNHYLKGDFRAALKLYLSLLNTNTSHKLYYEIGRCYYKLGDILNAENYFNRSVAMEPFKNPAYLFLGNIFFKNSNVNKAIENWSYAYAYHPDNEAVCLNLATSYYSKGMKAYSFHYYEKYLKYSQNQTESYNTVKESIHTCKQNAKKALEEAKKYVSNRNYKKAIEILTTAVQNVPIDFDINYYLGNCYFEVGMYLKAMIYLKEALCIDKKSVDTLQKIILSCTNIGDFTTAYCCLKRLLPLIKHNQKEYLNTLKNISEFAKTFNNQSYIGHLEWGDKYFKDNNYTLALFEYENCVLLDDKMQFTLEEKIKRIKSIIQPENWIIKTCIEKGNDKYNRGDFKTSNKYFTKIMLLSNENSSEYKLAKSKIINV